MISAYIIGDCDVRLWGLTSNTRIARQLAAIGGITLMETRAELPSEGRVLLLRADYLLEARTLIGLLNLDGILQDGDIPAAAHVAAGSAPEAVGALGGHPTTLPTFGIQQLDRFEGRLRKSEAPLLEAIAIDRQQRLENRLYGVSYKGITDFVTKWWWPVPAKVGVRLCANLRITPNAVTAMGILLMLGTCWLFYDGRYLLGLLLGWIMTYLDTVDGKLARVTVQSSTLGHVLDHGMDIIHPPFWYWFWALSLTEFRPLWGIDADLLVAAMFAGYIGGRLVEAVFHALGEVDLFSWRPFDAYFRLFTGRRNPCMVLLTLGWALGEPVWSLWWVAAWTVFTTLVMIVRLGCGLYVRMTQGPLTSWLAEATAATRYPKAHRTFASTRRAYG